MESHDIRKYLLQEFIEPDFSEPELFDSYEEAHKRMKEYFFTSTNSSKETYKEELSYELESGDAGIGKWSAYCQNKNHDNCSWQISVLDINGDSGKDAQAPCEFCGHCDFDSMRAIVQDGKYASIVFVGGMSRYSKLLEGSRLRFCPVCGRDRFKS